MPIFIYIPPTSPPYPSTTVSVNQFYSLLERAEVFQNWNEVCSNLESQLACFTAEGRLLACQEEGTFITTISHAEIYM